MSKLRTVKHAPKARVLRYTFAMKNTATAFRWIVRLLRKNHIPFQITGGQAARAYGSKRPLADIDFDMLEKDIPKVAKLTQGYIVFGPKHFRNKNWDLEVMTLSYMGQEVDIAGARKTKVYDHRLKRWVGIPTDLRRAQIKSLYDLRVPVVQKEELIAYKTLLGRRVDKADIRDIS
jgi:hypothetical protein